MDAIKFENHRIQTLNSFSLFKKIFASLEMAKESAFTGAVRTLAINFLIWYKHNHNDPSFVFFAVTVEISSLRQRAKICSEDNLPQ